eukprot:8148940-Alexandrium_andersonii.AAC.1
MSRCGRRWTGPSPPRNRSLLHPSIHFPARARASTVACRVSGYAINAPPAHKASRCSMDALKCCADALECCSTS